MLFKSCLEFLLNNMEKVTEMGEFNQRWTEFYNANDYLKDKRPIEYFYNRWDGELPENILPHGIDQNRDK